MRWFRDFVGGMFMGLAFVMVVCAVMFATRECLQ